MEYLITLSTGMRRRRVRSRLIRYRQMLINAGINLELAEQVVKIWRRGVRTKRDRLILDHISEALIDV